MGRSGFIVGMGGLGRLGSGALGVSSCIVHIYVCRIGSPWLCKDIVQHFSVHVRVECMTKVLGVWVFCNGCFVSFKYRTFEHMRHIVRFAPKYVSSDEIYRMESLVEFGCVANEFFVLRER